VTAYFKVLSWHSCGRQKQQETSVRITSKVKVKLFLCFYFSIRVPCHEGVLGEWRYSSTYS
jgi:hypothetical protein